MRTRLAPSPRLVSGLLIWLAIYLPAINADAFDSVLQPFHTEYQLSRDGVHIGSMEIRLERPRPERYIYSSLTLPAGIVAWIREDEISEQSAGRIQDHQLLPEQYHYQRKNPDRIWRTEISFDWQNQRIITQTNNSSWRMPAPANTIDKMVSQLAFMASLAAGQEAADFPVADGGKLKDYHYRVIGREPVTTALGTFNTIKVERSKADRPVDYTLWFAPALRYLPVRIERTRDDHRYQSELTVVLRPNE